MARPEELTKEWQIAELEKPVLPHFIRDEQEVHGKFTSVDYVRLMLNYVFPGAWDFELISEPSRIDLNVNTALYVCAARLSVTWADGTRSFHEASGAVKLEAGWKKNENKPRPVHEANINQHIMGYLGCRSSALKSCAADLGTVFRPLSDDKVSEFVYMREQKRIADESKRKAGIDPNEEEDPAKSRTDLFGDETIVREVADQNSVGRATEDMPSDITELYTMGPPRFGWERPHIRNIIENYLEEQYQTRNIGKYLQMEPDNIKVLWQVLLDHEAAKQAELSE